MTRSILYLLLLSSRTLLDVACQPVDLTEDNDDLVSQAHGGSWTLSELQEDNELEARRDEALEKLQEVLGIRSHTDKATRRKVPPQFMMELYNNVADPSGVTRGRNPYNAKVVRSFIERDTSMSRFYFFNISGLEANESVLEAELHLYRKRASLKAMHPSTISSPYYLIRVYQVLDERSLDVPDLHRLLNVRYVGAHATGWQIFNVKQAVLGWLNGEPNLGLLVTASTLFEDQVTVEFSRRNDYHHSKQPILVLFDDDDDGDNDDDGRQHHRAGKKTFPRYYAYENDNDVEGEVSFEEDEGKVELGNDYDANRGRRHKRQRAELEEARWEAGNEPALFRRQKRIQKKSDISDAERMQEEANDGIEEKSEARKRRDVTQYRKRYKKVFTKKWPQDAPTSMEIYKRAMRRERSGHVVRRGTTPEDRREKRSTKTHGTVQANTTECSRHELYVDFKEIGLSSSIIAPKGYSAYHCKGICESPLSQEQQPTNHATIQGIVHKMDLVKGVDRPCCVPTKLLGTTILFFDDNENIVLKVYQDMIADRCGCR